MVHTHRRRTGCTAGRTVPAARTEPAGRTVPAARTAVDTRGTKGKPDEAAAPAACCRRQAAARRTPVPKLAVADWPRSEAVQETPAAGEATEVQKQQSERQATGQELSDVPGRSHPWARPIPAGRSCGLYFDFRLVCRLGHRVTGVHLKESSRSRSRRERSRVEPCRLNARRMGRWCT